MRLRNRRPSAPRLSLLLDDRGGRYEVSVHPTLHTLERQTVPVPGMPGTREDPLTGARWYSTLWLDGMR